MNFRFSRTLRTLSSERFLLQSDAADDVAVLDLHYLADGSVVGTLIIMEEAFLTEGKAQAMLQFIDEGLLPMASLDKKNLSFTVVSGKLMGQFENEN